MSPGPEPGGVGRAVQRGGAVGEGHRVRGRR